LPCNDGLKAFALRLLCGRLSGATTTALQFGALAFRPFASPLFSESALFRP
jgi:hypothetical protein